MQRERVLVVIVAMLTVAGTAMAQVDCDAGGTIAEAVASAHPGDTIQVSGMCHESITITTDHVTLDGGGSAIIQGAGGEPPGNVSAGLVNIIGAQGVEIRGFTVQGSPVDGINGRQGAAFVVRDTRVLQSGDDGIEATENSTVRFLGTCTVRGSGDMGIAITHGSSAHFVGERVRVAQNATAGLFLIGTSTAAFDAGIIRATQNVLGILALGHSSLTLNSNMPRILADENTLDGILVADTSDLRLDGGRITASRNGRAGLWFGGTAGLGNIAGEIVSEHNAEGMRAEDSSRITQLIAGRMTVQHNTIGIVGETGSLIRIRVGGTITENDTDIRLIFGSLGSFEGDTNVGTIVCDATSRVQVEGADVPCPTP